MKFFGLFVLCLASLWAQTPPAPAPPALPNLPDETVVATFDDGANFTMRDMKAVLSAMGPDNQRLAAQDPVKWLESFAFMRKLTIMANVEKLAEQSPTKDQINYAHMVILSQAEVGAHMHDFTVAPGDIEKYYVANKQKFEQVKADAILIRFSKSMASGSGGKTPLTEEQAKAKAAKLVADLRGGADFAKLAKENSDDEDSRAKGGFFALLKPTDSIPDAIRAAVFQLKPGAITDPIPQPNGYYIFRAEEVSFRPLSEVRDQIFTAIQAEHGNQWIEKTHTESKPTYVNPAIKPAAPAK